MCDIGTERPAIVAEPLVDPFKQPAPAAPTPAPVQEPVAA